ncbi:MAG: hypothetical protein IPK13_09905 [Deltaproteobacteria bacterium]|nr:hypothetical protein [Deltaproteobacteria bacterium]
MGPNDPFPNLTPAERHLTPIKNSNRRVAQFGAGAGLAVGLAIELFGGWAAFRLGAAAALGALVALASTGVFSRLDFAAAWKSLLGSWRQRAR